MLAQFQGGVHRLYPTASIPFDFRRAGRCGHVVYAQEVNVCLTARRNLLFFAVMLLRPYLWSADDCRLFAVPPADFCRDRAGRGNRHRYPRLLQMVVAGLQLEGHRHSKHAEEFPALN